MLTPGLFFAVKLIKAKFFGSEADLRIVLKSFDFLK